MKKRKICHVQLLPLMSGVQKVTLDELQFVGVSYENYLILKEEGKFSALVNDSKLAKLVFIPSLVREISLFNDVKALFNLSLTFNEYKPDVVHTHSSKTGVLGRIAAKITGVDKIVHTVHGYAFPFSENKLQYLIYFYLEKIASYCSDRIIVLNQHDYLFTVNELGVDAKKVSLIPNAINIEAYTPNIKNVSPTFINEDTFNIVMVGRLWDQKNPKLLLEGFCKLLQKFDNLNAKLFFVGDGPLHSELKEIARSYSVESQVVFLGWRDDVSKILSFFDLFVLPSKWEGMPLSILEAFAAKVPVLVSDIPGNTSLVNDMVGNVFINDDLNDLVRHLESSIFSPDKSKIDQAFDYVNDQHSWYKRSKSLRSIYD